METNPHTLTVDEATRAKLLQAARPVELCDEAGRSLGRFIPRLDPALYEGLEPDISDEEIERRKREDRRYTTAEVLAYLEKL